MSTKIEIIKRIFVLQEQMDNPQAIGPNYAESISLDILREITKQETSFRKMQLREVCKSWAALVAQFPWSSAETPHMNIDQLTHKKAHAILSKILITGNYYLFKTMGKQINDTLIAQQIFPAAICEDHLRAACIGDNLDLVKLIYKMIIVVPQGLYETIIRRKSTNRLEILNYFMNQLKIKLEIDKNQDDSELNIELMIEFRRDVIRAASKMIIHGDAFETIVTFCKTHLEDSMINWNVFITPMCVADRVDVFNDLSLHIKNNDMYLSDCLNIAYKHCAGKIINEIYKHMTLGDHILASDQFSFIMHNLTKDNCHLFAQLFDKEFIADFYNAMPNGDICALMALKICIVGANDLLDLIMDTNEQNLKTLAAQMKKIISPYAKMAFEKNTNNVVFTDIKLTIKMVIRIGVRKIWPILYTIISHNDISAFEYLRELSGPEFSLPTQIELETLIEFAYELDRRQIAEALKTWPFQ